MKWFRKFERIDYDAVFAADDRVKEAGERFMMAPESEKQAWREYFDAVAEATVDDSISKRAHAVLAIPFPEEER